MASAHTAAGVIACSAVVRAGTSVVSRFSRSLRRSRNRNIWTRSGCARPAAATCVALVVANVAAVVATGVAITASQTLPAATARAFASRSSARVSPKAASRVSSSACSAEIVQPAVACTWLA